MPCNPKKSLEAWCKVRNSKKWKHNLILKRENLTARKLRQNGDKFQILFSWNSKDNWSEILQKNGENTSSSIYETSFKSK